MNDGKIFRIEVRCAFPEWDRYNLHVTATCFDGEGRMTDYVSLPGNGNNAGPSLPGGASLETPSDGHNPTTPHSAVLETPPCNHVEAYIYVVAREFPASEIIAASPPFDIEVATRAGSEAAKSKVYPVNQWGGASIKLSLT